MARKALTKTRKLINHLTKPNSGGITESEARNMYGIADLPSMIYKIKQDMTMYGNWELTKEKTPRGKTRYFMIDTHPGKRTYRFNKDGSRCMIK